MHTATLVGHQMFVFGGWAGGNIFLNDLYAPLPLPHTPIVHAH
jgi:hypothetical protein